MSITVPPRSRILGEHRWPWNCPRRGSPGEEGVLSTLSARYEDGYEEDGLWGTIRIQRRSLSLSAHWERYRRKKIYKDAFRSCVTLLSSERISPLQSNYFRLRTHSANHCSNMKAFLSVFAGLVATITALPGMSPVSGLEKRDCVIPSGCTVWDVDECEYCCTYVPSQCHVHDPVVICPSGRGVVFHCDDEHDE